MEPETLETLVKEAGLVIGLSAVGLATILTTAITGLEIGSRLGYVREYRESYKKGLLRKKPNIFNIRKIMDPQYGDKYWVSL